MGSCIICGTSVDGHICDVHEEDVVFEFRGTRPGQLTPGRFYRGTVDGYAEFGIFVDIGDRVTGLLHKSELDQRLDSLDWESGDTVFVQVKNVRDNGNIDLGWSIRQREREFRGTLVDDPEKDHAVLADDDPETATDGEGADVTVTPTDNDQTRSADSQDTDATSASGDSEGNADSADEESSAGEAATAGEIQQLTVDVLEDNVGSLVRLEGEIVDARQTSGPTVFQLRDETGTVECAAFEEAGVRAYPHVDEGSVVRIEGEIEERRGEIQVETEGLVVLEADERDAVTERMEDAMVQRARPEAVEPLADDPAVEDVTENLRDAATAIRRAVLEGRPVVVRHSATVDGYVGGAAIERATLPLIDREHTDADAEYHYFDRRPLEGSVYDMDDATKDVTTMLSNRERHDEALPLFVFVAAGGTAESLDGYDLLTLYGARTLVVEAAALDDEVAEAADVLVSAPEDAPDTTATGLAANVAAHVNDDVRADLAHLPAVSFWNEAPAAYDDLAAETGYGVDAVREIREAIALEAYYQSYEDKRELIVDLLFAEAADDQRGLAGHVSEQYRRRMDTAIETAEANLETVQQDGATLLVLDTEAYTHRYEFPGADLLLDELHRRHRDDADAILGLGGDEAYLRSGDDLDVRAVVADAADDAPSAGLDARGAREGRVEFLSGERDTVREALIEALGHELSSKAAA
ncbi:OB-fold nucleic acid binding domain-containing protein [Halobacteriales archaeon Cl-PHB]